MARDSKRESPILLLALLGGLLLSFFINYHSYLANFNLVPGDRGDTRLLVFTLEHWFNVFRGQEAFYSLRMFYPDALPLAYSDGLFLFAFPYSIFRLLGRDYFTSYQLLLPVMTGLGYLAWIVLLRRALGLAPGAAILGAIMLTSLNSLQLQADIGQLKAIHIYPVLIGLLWVFGTAEERTGCKATLSLAGFGAGLGLLFYTSYYPAWFFLFALGLFGVVGLVAGIVVEGPGKVLGRLRGFLAGSWRQLAAALAAFGICLIPFIVTYAPLILSNSSRSFGLALEFSPTIRDVINVSEHNYVWSPILRGLGFGFGNREVQMGSPVLVLLLSVTTAGVLVGRLRRDGWSRLPSRDRFLLLLSATAVVIATISIKIGGFSLWYMTYRAVPGASALRAVGRILMVVDMISIIVAIYGLGELLRSLTARPARSTPFFKVGLVILGAVLIAEQANATPFRLNKADQLAFMDRFRMPPVQCIAFFINNAASEDLPFGYYQLDAMMISMQLGIPTVNGYSGFEPDRAFTLVPKGIEYKYRILDWLLLHHATDAVCELDYQSATFRQTDVTAEHQEYHQLYLAGFLEMFSTLYTATTQFIADGNSLADLHPQYLEENGYLDPSLGYQGGLRYKWLNDRYWIGDRPCGKRDCFGIGVAGTYAEVKGILEEFSDQAVRVFFPLPEEWHAGETYSENASGELLMTFAADEFRH